MKSVCDAAELEGHHFYRLHFKSASPYVLGGAVRGCQSKELLPSKLGPHCSLERGRLGGAERSLFIQSLHVLQDNLLSSHSNLA